MGEPEDRNLEIFLTSRIDFFVHFWTSSFFEIHFRIKTSDKKRRFDLSRIIFQVVEEANEICIYKYKLRRENVRVNSMPHLRNAFYKGA